MERCNGQIESGRGRRARDPGLLQQIFRREELPGDDQSVSGIGQSYSSRLQSGEFERNRRGGVRMVHREQVFQIKDLRIDIVRRVLVCFFEPCSILLVLLIRSHDQIIHYALHALCSAPGTHLPEVLHQGVRFPRLPDLSERIGQMQLHGGIIGGQ